MPAAGYYGDSPLFHDCFIDQTGGFFNGYYTKEIIDLTSVLVDQSGPDTGRSKKAVSRDFIYYRYFSAARETEMAVEQVADYCLSVN